MEEMCKDEKDVKEHLGKFSRKTKQKKNSLALTLFKCMLNFARDCYNVLYLNIFSVMLIQTLLPTCS